MASRSKQWRLICYIVETNKTREKQSPVKGVGVRKASTMKTEHYALKTMSKNICKSKTDCIFLLMAALTGLGATCFVYKVVHQEWVVSSTYSMAVLISGLLFTCLIVGGLSYTQAQRARLNRLLKFQIEARQELERDGIALQKAMKSLEEKTAALRESEERFKHIADSNSDLIWETDRLGLFTYCSSALPQILGFAPEEVIGKKHFYDFFVPQQRLELKNKAFAVFERKQSFQNFVNECVRKDGSTAILETSGFPVIDHNGLLLGYRGTDKDITERVEAQRAQKLLATAVEQAAEATMITDVSGVIQYVNPAFETITGYSEIEVIGRNPNLLKSGKHDESFYLDLWDTIKAGRVWTGTLINKTRDKSLIHLETSISPVFDSFGQVTNYVSVNRDVTKEQLIQAQLLQARKMEAIGMLSAGIAHDFNNLIHAMNGYAELALDRSLDSRQRESHLTKIIQASERACEMVRQILSFSRKSDLEDSFLDISPIVKECLRFLRGTIPTSISLDIRLDDNIPAIHGNPTQIYQVLMNLCINSVYSIGQSHGSITVSLSAIDIDPDSCRKYSLVEPGKYVRLEVKDTGKGIAAKIQDKIFEPHFTTKTNGEGSGLGLSTVLGIVKSHGGAVQVDSQSGVGATFSVFFPAVEKKAPEPSSVDSNFDFGAGKRVLCLDDDPDLLPIYEGSLQKLGFTVVATQSPEEAIEILLRDQQTFDLIITDLTMPKMTGVEFATEIHSICSDIPVVICTGYNNFYLTPELKDRGIRDIIYKPLSRNALAKAIAGIFHSKRSP